MTHAAAADRPPLRPTHRQSRVALGLWVLLSAFILWGSLIPFRFEWDLSAAVAKTSTMSMNPFLAPGGGRRVSIPDVAQNVLLFVPFGLFGVAALIRRRPSPLVPVLAVSVLAVFFSVLTEALQLFTIDRISSPSDVLFNSTGGVMGAIAAGVLFARRAREGRESWAIPLMDEPAFYPMAIAFALLCIAAWEPFDVTLEAGAVWHKVKALRADVWQGQGISDEGLEFVRYVLFAAAASIWLDRLQVQGARRIAAMLGVSVAAVLEVSQFFVETRVPGAEDMLVHAAGAMTGALVAPAARAVSPAIGVAILAIATWVGGAMQGAGPAAWMPFLREAGGTAVRTPGHAIELALMYFPLGFSWPLAIRRPAVHWLASAVGAAAIALSLQYWPHGSPGRSPDVAALAVAVSGCLAGVWVGGTGWSLFDRWISALQVRHLLHETRTRGRASGRLDRAPR